MVLVVAIILLLLAGLLTLFALKVGVFEQRSTGNDLRSKLVGEVAEAGLAQGFEYLYRQHKAMLKDPTLWERCAADDDSFPCGAITAAPFDDDGDPATDPIPRRAQMFRLKANVANTIAGLDGALSRYMLPLPAAS
jgi:Tfp pilus assembly protein PilX